MLGRLYAGRAGQSSLSLVWRAQSSLPRFSSISRSCIVPITHLSTFSARSQQTTQKGFDSLNSESVPELANNSHVLIRDERQNSSRLILNHLQARDYASALNLCGKIKDQFWHGVTPPYLDVFNLKLLTHIKRKDPITQAWRTFSDIEYFGLVPDNFTMISMLKCYFIQPDTRIEDVKATWNMLKRYNFSPSLTTFLYLCKIFQRDENPDMMWILQELITYHREIDPQTCVALVRPMILKNNSPREALKMMLIIKEQYNVEVPEEDYRRLLLLAIRTGDQEVAHAVAEKVKTLYPGNCLTILDYCVRNGDVALCNHIWKFIDRTESAYFSELDPVSNPQYDDFTSKLVGLRGWHCRLYTYANAGMHEELMTLICRFNALPKEHFVTPLKPSSSEDSSSNDSYLRLTTGVLDFLARTMRSADKVDRAYFALTDISRRGRGFELPVLPLQKEVTLHTLEQIELQQNQQQHDQIETSTSWYTRNPAAGNSSLYASPLSSSVERDFSTPESLHDEPPKKMVLSISDKISEHGALRVTADPFNIIIRGCAYFRDISRAFETLRDMEESGIQPCVETYNSMLLACERVRWKDNADELFNEMKSRGIKPNADTILNYLVLLAEVGADQQVEDLLTNSPPELLPMWTYERCISLMADNEMTPPELLQKILGLMKARGFNPTAYIQRLVKLRLSDGF